MTKDIGNFKGNNNLPVFSGVWSIFDQIFFKKRSEWPEFDYIVASWSPLPAGTSFDSGDFRTVVFTSSATLAVDAVSAGTSVDYLVVAGGGGGGSGISGGGGAGGFRTGTTPISPGSYTITVGAGGAVTSAGTPSVFGSITSAGGGNGRRFNSGIAGGSGGGGAWTGPTPSAPGGAGNTPPVSPPQGNAGGSGINGFSNGAGGGGGGGGAIGSQFISRPDDPNHYNGGPGGSGEISPITLPGSYGTAGPSPGRYFSGGGGGGITKPGVTPFIPLTVSGSGGAGGGGEGGKYGSSLGISGTVNTGGGGGGGGSEFDPVTIHANGGSGGSGIVVLIYKYH